MLRKWRTISEYSRRTKMVERLQSLTKNHSMFLFGARGTGKSTLLNTLFPKENSYWINLLDPEQEHRFGLFPEELISIVEALPEDITYVIIDEIQKIPKLLDCVHLLIEKTKKLFILTGSSACKLKRGGANLLAGRAFVYELFPFSFFELDSSFDAHDAMKFGLLPKIYQLLTPEDKKSFLQSYAFTYIKEEIVSEQIIRKLDPFRKFLEFAAQCNGKIINFASVAKDVGVDDKTIKSYYEILEDTLIGFFIEPYHTSVRKRLSQKPKFYFFDCGVTRALARRLSLDILSGNSYYGECFEHLVILEIFKLIRYKYSEFKLGYLKTKEDNEVDLIIERPGQKTLYIEIKSTINVQENHVSFLNKLSTAIIDGEFYCFSQDKVRKKLGSVTCMEWKQGILELLPL